MNYPPFVTDFLNFVQSLDLGSYLRDLILFAVVLCACGVAVRLVLGKGSGVCQALAACLSIQFTYLVAVGLYVLLPVLRSELYALPFIEVNAEQFRLWELLTIPDETLSGCLVGLTLLSILVNVLETYLPKAKKPLPWLLWRFLSALIAIAIYSFLCLLINAAAPEVFGFWGLVAVLLFWVVVMVIGLLHLLLNITLSSVGKMLGKLYKFFYTDGFGKLLTKSIFSSIAFMLVILVLNREGVGTFLFADFALAPYASGAGFVLILLFLFQTFL